MRGSFSCCCNTHTHDSVYGVCATSQNPPPPECFVSFSPMSCSLCTLGWIYCLCARQRRSLPTSSPRRTVWFSPFFRVACARVCTSALSHSPRIRNADEYVVYTCVWTTSRCLAVIPMTDARGPRGGYMRGRCANINIFMMVWCVFVFARAHACIYVCASVHSRVQCSPYFLFVYLCCCLFLVLTACTTSKFIPLIS